MFTWKSMYSYSLFVFFTFQNKLLAHVKSNFKKFLVFVCFILKTYAHINLPLEQHFLSKTNQQSIKPTKKTKVWIKSSDENIYTSYIYMRQSNIFAVYLQVKS